MEERAAGASSLVCAGLKCAMRMHAPILICSTGVSNFQTFKPLFAMYNKLRQF